MSITVLFDPPLPSDNPATFNQKAFTLLGDLNDWSDEANTTAGEINADKTALLNAGLATVAANVSNVAAVGTDIANVNTVASNLNGSNTIGTVAGSIGNVNATGGSIANVNTTATNIANVNTVASNLAGTNTIGTVAGSINNVNTVGTNIAAINTNATNISAIQQAAANATAAANSASAASTSATNAQNSANAAANSATAAATSATTAVNAPGTSGTSSTSLTVALGSFSLTTQSGKAWVPGQFVVIARTSAPATTWMFGQITSYTSGSGLMNVTVASTSGTGTHTDWTIGLSGPNNGVDSTDIGTAPNEIPLNQYLGSLAYEDTDSLFLTGPATVNVTSSTDALRITQNGSGNAIYVEDVAADATPFVVSSTGVVGIGTTTPDNVTPAGIALVSNDGFMPQIVNRNKTVDANAAYTVFDKDRNGAIVNNGDVLGNVVFRGFGGTNYHQAAAIMAVVDGAPANNDMPGRLVFLTTLDGQSAPTESLRIDNTGSVTVRRAAGLGYGTGAGGAQTQGAGSGKATGVTLNTPCGQITMNNASLNASTAVSFTLTNSVIAATDVVNVSIASGATAGAYAVMADQVSAGSCRISLRNLTGGALAEAVVLNFVVVKAVAA